MKPPSDAIPFLSAEQQQSAGNGVLRNKVTPIYPEAAKIQHISGAVILDAMIGKDGKVTDIRVVSSSSWLLNSAAIDAVAHWQYSPFLLDGQPQDMNTVINVMFFFG